MKKYRTVLYLRLSKEDEKIGESDSISNQKSMLKDFVNSREDLHLVKIMIDELAIIRLNLKRLFVNRVGVKIFKTFCRLYILS